MKITIHLFCLLVSFAVFAQKNKKSMIMQANPSVLSLNAKNLVTIDVPNLREKENLVLTSPQAEIKQSVENKTRFLIIPKEANCIVEVSTPKGKKNKKIGKINFTVLSEPSPAAKPRIALWLNNSIEEMTAETKVSKGGRVTLTIVPDSIYKKQYPEEARYEVSQIEVLMKKGKDLEHVGGSILTGRDATQGIALPIPATAFSPESDGVVYFVIKDILHKNAKGEIFIDTRFTEAEKTLIVKVKK